MPAADDLMARKSGIWFVRISRSHPRLLISIAIGVVAYATLAGLAASLGPTSRAIAAWDIAILCYLGATLTMMAKSSWSDIAGHADAQDEGAFGIFILTVFAGMASLGAIFGELASSDKASPGYGLNVAFGIVTVVLSWAFIHTIFALHYAYEYYDDTDCTGGLKFPDDDKPDYWDFMYFAFVLGMTFQVSDVAITAKWVRRIAMVHGILAFFFTTAVVALTVNLAANFMQK
jgi:uncharacterized membrane protein